MPYLLSRGSLTSRLWMAVAVLLSGMLLALAVGLLGLHQSRASLQRVQGELLGAALLAGDIATATQLEIGEMLRAMQHAPQSFTAPLHDHPVDVHVQAVETQRSFIDDSWRRLAAASAGTQRAAAAAEVTASLTAWHGKVGQTLQAIQAGSFAAQVVTDLLRASMTEAAAATRSLERFRGELRGQVEQAATQADRTYRQTITAAVASVLLLLLPATALVAWTLRRQARGLARTLSAIDAVAASDLSQTLPRVEGDDEIAKLNDATRRMQAQLRQVVTAVRSEAKQVASASAEIASGNLDLSQRTEQQAGSVQQTASAMEQLGTSVQHTADSAALARQTSHAAAAVASEVGLAMGETMQTMQDVDAASRRIADIVGTIDSIAFQTNILALNAAVEAARAGAEGRGFAVVASEVRALAQRSAGAAREIKSLIDNNVQKVAQGNERVQSTGRMISELVGSIRKVNDLVSEISQATQEQSLGVSASARAAASVESVTQQNAALVEQSAAAARQLEEQAQRLLTSVSAFLLEAGPS